MTLRITIIAAVFLAAALPTNPWAQTINGCVKDKSGAFRIVSDPADCTSRESPISWNQVGPQGEPGIDGVDGAPGADGSGAEVLHVFDRNGVDLGIYAGREANLSGTGMALPYVFWIYLSERKITTKVRAATGIHELDRSPFFFAEYDCQGPAYSQLAGMLLQPNIESNMAWFITSIESVPVVVRSQGLTGNATPCQGSTAIREMMLSTVRAVDPATDLGLSFPLPAPLYVGLPAE